MKHCHYHFGSLLFFDRYYVAEINEGLDLNLAIVDEIREIASAYYGINPYGFIANRINSYSIDPCIHLRRQLFAPNLKAVAVVVYTRQMMESLLIERHFMKGDTPVEIFSGLDDAQRWMDATISKHLAPMNGSTDHSDTQLRRD